MKALLVVWFTLFVTCGAVFEKPVLETKIEATIVFCGQEDESQMVESTVFDLVQETQGWEPVVQTHRKRNCTRSDGLVLQIFCPDEESQTETSFPVDISTPELKTALVSGVMMCSALRSFGSFGLFDRSKLTILQSAIDGEDDSIILFVGNFVQDTLFWEIWLDSLRLHHLNVMWSSFGDAGNNQIFLINKFNRSTYFNDNRTEFEIYVRELFANYSQLEDPDDAETDDPNPSNAVTTELPLIKMVDYHHKRVVRLREEHSLRKYSAGIIAVISLFVLLIIYIVITLVKHLRSSRA